MLMFYIIINKAEKSIQYGRTYPDALFFHIHVIITTKQAIPIRLQKDRYSLNFLVLISSEKSILG